MRRLVSPTPTLLAVAAAAGAAALLSGCSSQSPTQSLVPYQAADGVAVNLGSIQVRDLVVVSPGKDQTGVLSGVVINNGAQSVTVSFATQGGGSASANVPAHQEAQLSGGTDAAPASLQSVGTAPGGLVELQVSTPDAGTENVQVPVLLPQLYYSTVTPASPAQGASSAPTTSPSATSSAPTSSAPASPTSTATAS